MLFLLWNCLRKSSLRRQPIANWQSKSAEKACPSHLIVLFICSFMLLFCWKPEASKNQSCCNLRKISLQFFGGGKTTTSNLDVSSNTAFCLTIVNILDVSINKRDSTFSVAVEVAVDKRNWEHALLSKRKTYTCSAEVQAAKQYCFHFVVFQNGFRNSWIGWRNQNIMCVLHGRAESVWYCLKLQQVALFPARSLKLDEIPLWMYNTCCMHTQTKTWNYHFHISAAQITHALHVHCSSNLCNTICFDFF